METLGNPRESRPALPTPFPMPELLRSSACSQSAPDRAGTKTGKSRGVLGMLGRPEPAPGGAGAGNAVAAVVVTMMTMANDDNIQR